MRTLIVGASMLGQDIAERMVLYPAMGYQYVGFLDDAPPEKIHYHLRGKFNLLNTMDHFKEVCHDHDIDAIFVANRFVSQRMMRDMVEFCDSDMIELNIMSDPFLNTPFVEGKVFDGMPLLRTLHHDQRNARTMG